MKSKIFVLALLLFFVPADVYAGTKEHEGSLWLINQENRLSEAYVPDGLEWYGGLQMRGEIIKPYKEMLAAMKKDGIDGLYIQSAYRDYAHQRFLHNTKTESYTAQGHDREEAEALAARSIAYPGASEHQSGLAIDVTLDGRLRQSFGETEAGAWIAENCQEFGFIVRRDAKSKL